MDVSFDHGRKEFHEHFLDSISIRKTAKPKRGFDPIVKNNSVIFGMGHSKAVSIQQPRCLNVTYLDKGEHSY